MSLIVKSFIVNCDTCNCDVHYIQKCFFYRTLDKRETQTALIVQRGCSTLLFCRGDSKLFESSGKVVLC